MASSDDDPANAASDALSLHTIADQADAYAAQEQSDADFAFALQLADEEGRGLDPRNVHENVLDEGFVAQIPYRDDPEAGDDEALLPYRDDPNVVADSEDTHTSASPTKIRRFRLPRPAFLLQKLRKPKPWHIALSTFLLIFFTIGLTLLIMLLLKTSNYTAKERAWRDSSSRNDDLKLPALYPKLEANASSECKSTWKQYAASLKCHEQILSAVWDNGDAETVRKEKMHPWAYSQMVCSEECRKSISRLEIPVGNDCYRRWDRFNVRDYGSDRKQYFDKRNLPEGPVEAQRQLAGRYQKLCARPPKDMETGWGTCASDLWMKWGVVDGIDAHSMSGVMAFRDKTSQKKDVDGRRLTGTVDTIDGKKKYDVSIPIRRVGPGSGETNCGWCTADWLRRKMRAFEYGAMLDPTTGVALGLKDFDALMSDTLQRCAGIGRSVKDVHEKWEKVGWWCDGLWPGRPCHEDKNATSATDVLRMVLHGMKEDDWPLPKLRSLSEEEGAETTALMTLHDSLLSLPCGMWFNEQDAIRHVIPSHYTVSQLCSDRCRNAIERVDIQHGASWASLSTTSRPNSIFGTWALAVKQVEQICTNNRPNVISKFATSFCAPGYASLGHAEWTFSPPPFAAIVSSFNASIDTLERKLPYRVPKPDYHDAEVLSTLIKTTAESVCNECAAELLVGRNPDWKGRVDEIIDSGEVDGRHYVNVARRWFIVCSKVVGAEIGLRQRIQIWERTGLDRYSRN